MNKIRWKNLVEILKLLKNIENEINEKHCNENIERYQQVPQWTQLRQGKNN